MATQDIFRTLIVQAEHASVARRVAATVAPIAGAGMWVVGLSEDGQAPASAYVSTGFVGKEWQVIMPMQAWAKIDGNWVQTAAYAGEPQTLLAAMQAADPACTITLQDIEKLFAHADVTEQEPEVVYERLGLQLIETIEDVL